MGHVTAVLVTRGDVALDGILASLPESWPVVVWDNSKREDLSVYGRYAALAEIDTPIAYVQDDDCVLDPEAFDVLQSACQPGILTANMPSEFRHSFYEHHCLVGFGAIFNRELPTQAFDRFFAHTGMDRGDPIFLNICDVVFTALVTRHLVDVPKRNLPWCNDDNRMWKQPDHQTSRSHMLKLALQAR